MRLSSFVRISHRTFFRSSIESFTKSTLQNGILSSDTYFQKGVPEAVYPFPATSTTLEKEFDRVRNTSKRPLELVESHMKSVSEGIKKVIGSDHPVLSEIASYFFQTQGKRMRPIIVLLTSMALHPIGKVSEAQARLAEISELIHVASLLHDDVIDGAETRRGIPSINSMFGNKAAVLGGDYLLARASVSLARLRCSVCTELMSVTIENLVKGEIIQMHWNPAVTHHERLSQYITKSYYKTASLLANSCKSVAVLGQCGEETQTTVYNFGKHLGLAFQIVDDILDVKGTCQSLGKPANADLSLGIATAPALYAAEEHDELVPLLQRRFNQEGDIVKASDLIRNSKGIERASQLARYHAEKACACLFQLEQSEARSALVQMIESILLRDR